VKDKKFLSTTELAEILGISRIAVYKKIKKGQIKAKKVGHDFVIDKSILAGVFDKELTQVEKSKIEKGVKKIVREYGETLRLLKLE